MSTPAPRRTRSAAREILGLVATALVLALVLKVFLLQAFYIPSASMLDTLHLDDRVLVEKVSYRFREPERGETIVFHDPAAVPAPGVRGAARSLLTGLGLPGGDMDLIKRVIGLPGEEVEIVDGTVHVDGQPLAEPYARTDGLDFAPVTVPEGHYFMLGDNRGNSNDSRYGLGMVPASAIVGRTVAVVWPPGNATTRLDADYAGAGETATAPAPAPAAAAAPIARTTGGG